MKDALLTMNGLVSFSNNAPVRYGDKQRQYLSPETKTFTQAYARYSSDYVEAQAQGLDPEAPFVWQTRCLRLADVVRPSAAISRHFDDYKLALFADRDVEYVAPGAKIVTMGSTWLAVNPANVSGADGGALLRRCNAVWNHLDWYGNVVSEPIVVENERANANDPDAQNSQNITKGYFNVICQYNDDTRQIDTNTRMILGSGGYRVTGFSDFETEFTGDYGSVRLLNFTVRYEEPNEAMDDMDRHVAGGRSFSWDVDISGPSSLAVGAAGRLCAWSKRNGAYVSGSAEQPVTYLWESSDEAVAAVDGDGLVTAISEGEAVITATLAQNPAYSDSFRVAVTEQEDGVFFTGTVPASIAAYDEAAVTAAYFEDGAETDEAVEFSFSGAAEGSYGVLTGPRAALIFCYRYSETPLTVTARHGDDSASAEIRLEGI